MRSVFRVNARFAFLILICFLLSGQVFGQIEAHAGFGSWGKTKDGRFAICHTIRLANNDTINSVCSPQILVDISDYPSVSSLTFGDFNGSGFDNSDFDNTPTGLSATNLIGNLIDPSTSKCINPGEKIYIKFTIYADPPSWPDGNRYDFDATGTGVNGATGNQSSLHNIRTNAMYDSNVILGGAQQIYQNGIPYWYGAEMQPNLDGTYDITYRVTIANYDNNSGSGGPATNITYSDELDHLFDYMPINSLVISDSGTGNYTINTNYTGGADLIGGTSVTPNENLITNGSLGPDAQDYVDILLNVGPIDLPQKLESRWTTGDIYADDSSGNPIYAQTADGLDPTFGDPNGPAVTCRNGLAIEFDYTANVEVSKALSNVLPAASGINGNYDLTYEINVTADTDNNVNIYRLSAVDSIAHSFGTNFVGISSIPVVSNSTASSTPLANSGFNGSTGSGSGSGVDLLLGSTTNLLEPGQGFTITYTAEVSTGNTPLDFINQVEVIANNTLDQLINSVRVESTYYFFDSDLDGVQNDIDLDDDNDGILDTDECTTVDSGLTGSLTFAANITSSDPYSQYVPHLLDSVTFNGKSYSDFIAPDSFHPYFTVVDDQALEFIQNGVIEFNRQSNSNFDTDILPAFQSRNLNAYINLNGVYDYSSGDYYELEFDNPIISNAGGFFVVTERGGNNAKVIQAIDTNGNLIGTPVTVTPTDYQDLPYQVHPEGWQNVGMALYPIDDLVSPGTKIKAVKISFTSDATTDGPDGKVFFLADGNLISSEACDSDIDRDGIPNRLDHDSDNDGCVDTIEAGHTDPDNDGYLGNSPVTVDANGLVTGQGGYTGATGNETVATQATMNTTPANQTTNNGASTSFTIDTGAINTTTFNTGTPDYSSGSDSSGQLRYQWQENGSDLSNGGVYSGANTATLSISDVSGLHGNNYSVLVTHLDNECIQITESADLAVIPDISIDDSSAVEGTNNVFTIIASHAIDQDVVFNIDYTDITTTNADYTGPTTINLLANTTSISFDVAAVEDTLIEPTETFEVGISYDSGANVNITDGQGTGTITDNDGGAGTGISFNNENITVDEAAGTATIEVLLTGNVAGGFTIDYTSNDVTAEQPGDYTVAVGTLTFNGTDGETQNIVVPITDDVVHELTQSFGITLSNISTSLININDSDATVTINDDDSARVFAKFVTVLENNLTYNLEVEVNAAVEHSFTVDYELFGDENTSLGGTANLGTDYSPKINTTLTFPANSPAGTVVSIPLTIIEDSVIEPTETIIQVLDNISDPNISILLPNRTFNIQDEDAVAGTGISFNNDNITVDEAAGTATVEVLLTGNVAGGFTLDYTTNDATAQQSGDFTTATGTLTFAGNDGEIQTITIPIIDDSVIEPSESLLVDLTNLSTTLIGINDAQATVNITDNDSGAGIGISFNNDNITVDEAAGTVTIEVLLTGNVAGGFTLDYTTNDGTAQQPGDYTTSTGTLTFAGSDGEIQNITIPIIDDNFIEVTENLLVDLSNLSTTLIGINDAQATVNITDNDGGSTTGLDFNSIDVTVDEAVGNAIVEVILTGNIQGGFTVEFTTVDDSAASIGDYSTRSGSLTFNGIDGEVQSVSVPIIDDNVIEATENLRVVISNPSAPLINLKSAQASINIIDNDSGAGTGISFNNDNITVDEAAGTATIEVLLTGNVPGGFTLDYTTNDGSALQPGDYTTASGTLTFAGTTGETQNVVVPIIDDALIEVTENLVVDLSNLSTTLIGINDAQATINITDNDGGGSTGITFNNDNITVDEAAGTATIEVLLTGNVPGGFTLDYTTADGTAEQPGDYTTASGTLTFAGTTGETQNVVVPIIDDALIEVTENLVVDLSNLSTTLIGINDAQATINITDNDGGGTTGVSFNNDNITVDEATGTATIEVLLTGNVPGGFTIDYTTNDGTAVQPGDYTTSAGTLTFTGNDGETQNVVVSIIDDALIEVTENLVVDLSNLSTTLIGINDAQATINITDNDVNNFGIDFNMLDVSVYEADGSTIFTVELTGNLPGGFTVDYTTSDGTATSGVDFITTSGVLTFAGITGEIQTITVPILDDDLIEPTEGYLVNLSNLSTTLIKINTPQVMGIIKDDDFDNDADGIPDEFDLDDDNDGIYDCIESSSSTESGFFTWSLNAPPGNLSMDFVDDSAISDWVLTSTANYTWNGITATPLGSQLQINNITSSSLNEALVNNHYIQVSFTTGSNLVDPELYDAAWGWASPESGDSYITSVAISGDDFSTYEFLSTDVFVTDPEDGSMYALFDLMQKPTYKLASDTTYSIRVYIYGLIDDTPEDYSIFDDLQFYINACQGVDSDNDGKLNHLDLDSDNDGIPDNVEAQTTLGYIISDGTVDSNGVDTAYSGGLTPVNTDGIDVADYLDLDSDNEGGNDTVEASITLTGNDSDNDGLDDVTDATNDYSDAGGTIDNALTGVVILPDFDDDVNSGGDIDFRDALDDTPIDLDSDDDGILDSFEDLNLDGDYDPSTDPTNSDNDAYPDYFDIDSDNDGIPDNVEAQSTAEYIPPSLQDDNSNGLDDAYEIGIDIGIIPVNTDGEDLPDYLDLDSDNDSILDSIEGNDYNHDGIPDFIFIGSDKDNDGLDDAFEGAVQVDVDVNDDINDPINDLPNSDEDDESDYRDFDDDGDGIDTIGEDTNNDGDYLNDDADNNGIPDYLDPESLEYEIVVFNVVTPNNDGLHDYLTITGLENTTNNTIKIYNRWGVLVYSTENYDTEGNRFTGESQARANIGQDKKLPVGTYFYILDYVNLDGSTEDQTGYLYLN